MTDAQIVTNAIKKAKSNSYDGWEHVVTLDIDNHPKITERTVGVYDIIFNHDFAKALWGDAEDAMGVSYRAKTFTMDGRIIQERLYVDAKMESYKLHLIRMVIADDPIGYLGEHI